MDLFAVHIAKLAVMAYNTIETVHLIIEIALYFRYDDKGMRKTGKRIIK
ncbi:hypothetical protein [Lacrimispora celerecrescens]|nr:hypothetical protein [Lacrimispora celerecrescens]